MVFTSESFDCDCALFAEVISRSFGERPLDESLGGNDLLRSRLANVLSLWNHRVREIDLEVNICFLWLK